MELLVAITGASGAVYGRRLLEALLEAGQTCHLVITPAGREVVRCELGMELSDPRELVAPGWWERLRCWDLQDWRCPFWSGSRPPDAMVVCPASMASVAQIAHGLADDLVGRAADVVLKQRRPLILVPRETPLSLIHLENLTALARAGAVVLPAMPGFYGRPRTVDDLVDFVVGRVLDMLGVKHGMGARWGKDEG